MKTFIIPNYHGLSVLLSSIDIPSGSTILVSDLIGNSKNNLKLFFKTNFRNINVKSIPTCSHRNIKAKIIFTITMLYSTFLRIFAKKTEHLIIIGFSPVQLFSAIKMSQNCFVEYYPILEEYYPCKKKPTRGLLNFTFIKLVQTITSLKLEYWESINKKEWIWVSPTWFLNKYTHMKHTFNISTKRLSEVIKIDDGNSSEVGLFIDTPLEVLNGINIQKSVKNIVSYFEKSKIKKIYIKYHPGYKTPIYSYAGNYEIIYLPSEVPAEFYLDVFKNKFILGSQSSAFGGKGVISFIRILEFTNELEKNKYLESFKIVSGNNYHEIEFAKLK
jgi:hypothetical protein